jgi:hypothetical protein
MGGEAAKAGVPIRAKNPMKIVVDLRTKQSWKFVRTAAGL